MASSQVEVTSLAPFGCVLRDHNRRDERRDRCREHNEKASENFQKNLKNLVKDHLQGCISVSSDPGPSSAQDENSENWVRGGDNQHQRSSQRFPRKHQNLGSGDAPSSLTTRQARVLDRWASQQARVIVSTVEHEAELLSTSLSNPSAAQPSESAALAPGRDNCPEVPEVSAIASNLGAFSLVQIWEARLNRPQNAATLSRTSSGTSSGITLSRTNSGISNAEEPPLTVPDAVESPPLVLERFESTRPGKDHKALLLVDLEPEKRTSPSIPSQLDQRPPASTTSTQAQNSDEMEKKESVRIVDIIKRLADQDPYTPNSHESLPGKDRVRPVKAQPERSLSFTQARIIKGRQAFTDMLKKMEQSRMAELTTLRERHTVSKFSQRARIQSMIRIRLMQRGMIMGQDQLHLPPPGNKNPQGSSSTIKHLRDRFNTCIERHKAAASDNVNSRNSVKENVNKSQNTSNSSSTNQQIKETPHQEATNVSQLPGIYSVQLDAQPSIPSLQGTVTSLSVSQRTPYEEANPHSDALSNGEDQNLQTSTVSQKTEDGGEEGLEESVMSSLQHSLVHCGEAGLGLDISIPSLDTTESINEWYDESEMTEELDDDEDQQPRSTNYDWISVISRPRSYWEGLRQKWYEKMRNTRSQNEEIPQLLARRRVSSFLDSGFREIMDRMLSSHVAIQTNVEALDDSQEHPSKLSYLQRHANHLDEQLQVEDEEEEFSSVTPQGNNGYSDQLPSPSPSRDWSYHDSDTASPHIPSQSPPFYQGSRRFSPRNTCSMERDFISHMEQIHHEISQLRSEIRSCVELQLKLQSSIKQEVYSALEEGKRRSYDRAPSKGNCCICYEKRVDSFLYRCGHMCACFNCAHELQCSSGQCPICGAAIDDVVRAHADC